MEYIKEPTGNGILRIVEIAIPDHLAFQLVFRQHRLNIFDVELPGQLKFSLVGNCWAALSGFSKLLNIFGPFGAIKALLKVMFGRKFYFIHETGVVLHTGWMMSSWCRYYRVEPGDVVIGPIWSAVSARGQGIGALGTQMAINAMMRQGHSVFFIDTSNNNVACLKMISKCDWKLPIATYLRD